MKNRSIFLALLVSFFSTNSFAQQSFTLAECIEYALDNAPSIKNANLDVKIAKAKVKETTAIGLPQLNGKWDMLHNVSVQKQFVPARIFDPTAPEDVLFPAPFGVDFSSNASLTATQLIFDGSYLVGLQAAKVYTELASQGVILSKEEVIVNVKKSYYMVLITQNRIVQLQENQKLLEQLLEDTKALFEAGFTESVDTKRVTVNLNNLKAELQKLTSFEAVSLNMLKFQMGMPISENITLSETLDKKIAEISLSSVTPNFENRPAFKMIEVQNELNALNLKNEKIKLLPSLAAFGTLGANYGTNAFGDYFNFSDYQDYSLVGLSLNVPLWSSGQRKFRIDQAKAETEKVQNDKKMLLNSFDMEFSQSESNLKNSLTTLKVREENVKLAEEVYENTQIKYKEGVGSSFEVTTAQNDLKTAQTEYYSALYDAIIAKIDIDKASGNLEVNR